jgi:hypothetical protein
MSLFTNIEKKIADSLVGLFSKAKNVETTVVSDVKSIEQEVVTDVKGAFEKARTDAVTADSEVDKLKADLQEALARASQLHQNAIDAAKVAQEAAEAEVARLKGMVAEHTDSLAEQSSPVTISAPAPVEEAPAPAVEPTPEPTPEVVAEPTPEPTPTPAPAVEPAPAQTVSIDPTTGTMTIVPAQPQ